MPISTVGEYLKEELGRRGWVCEDLAWRSGLRTSSIYRIITAQRQNIHLDTLEKIARGLGLTVPELCVLGGSAADGRDARVVRAPRWGAASRGAG